MSIINSPFLSAKLKDGLSFWKMEIPNPCYTAPEPPRPPKETHPQESFTMPLPPEKERKLRAYQSNVDHPTHYNQGDVECIDAIKAATVGKSGVEAFCVGNIIKYLWRYEKKNGIEDVKKAKWYLDRLIKELK